MVINLLDKNDWVNRPTRDIQYWSYSVIYNYCGLTLDIVKYNSLIIYNSSHYESGGKKWVQQQMSTNKWEQ